MGQTCAKRYFQICSSGSVSSESLMLTCKRVPCLDCGAVVHAIFLDHICAWINFRRKKCCPMTKTLPKTDVSMTLKTHVLIENEAINNMILFKSRCASRFNQKLLFDITAVFFNFNLKLSDLVNYVLRQS